MAVDVEDSENFLSSWFPFYNLTPDSGFMVRMGVATAPVLSQPNLLRVSSTWIPLPLTKRLRSNTGEIRFRESNKGELMICLDIVDEFPS